MPSTSTTLRSCTPPSDHFDEERRRCPAPVLGTRAGRQSAHDAAFRRARAETGSYAPSVIDRLPRVLLRAEGGAVAVTAIALYLHADYPWWLLVVLALAPDLSMVGYAAGPTIGAAAYDAAHTSLLPVVLAAIGVIADAEIAIQVGLIWLAHRRGSRDRVRPEVSHRIQGHPPTARIAANVPSAPVFREMSHEGVRTGCGAVNDHRRRPGEITDVGRYSPPDWHPTEDMILFGDRDIRGVAGHRLRDHAHVVLGAGARAGRRRHPDGGSSEVVADKARVPPDHHPGLRR